MERGSIQHGASRRPEWLQIDGRAWRGLLAASTPVDPRVKPKDDDVSRV